VSEIARVRAFAPAVWASLIYFSVFFSLLRMLFLLDWYNERHCVRAVKINSIDDFGLSSGWFSHIDYSESNKQSFAVHRSSFIVHRSSFIVHRSSFIVHRSSSLVVARRCVVLVSLPSFHILLKLAR
jgi:hypothetical protein